MSSHIPTPPAPVPNAVAKKAMVSPLGVLVRGIGGWPLGVLALLHIVGLCGLSVPAARPLFQALTPVNLLITASLLFFQHRPGNGQSFARLALAWAVAGLFCFSIEAIGIATGYPFGTYSYGPVLGWGPLGVPLLIGLNWAVLSYCACLIMSGLAIPLAARALLGGLLLAGYDAIMETAAMSLDFWYWPGGVVHPLNFIGWALTGTVACAIQGYLLNRSENALAAWVLVVQGVFFLVLSGVELLW